MTYGLFRWLTGIALHWFYSSITVTGRDHLPAAGPVIIAASHHNALVDALVAVWVTPRRLTLTAKATLMDHRFLAWLLSLVGVVPLRRASDEKRKPSATAVDTTRNAAAFERIQDVLETGGAVLIFPEGRSHSEPSLAPLKTGAARIAIEARDRHGLSSLAIVPLGLNFEDKGNPGTALLAEFGEPIRMDEQGSIAVEALTDAVFTRLAAVSLKRPAPSPDREAVRRKGVIRPLASPLAAWGELTHRYIINFARDLAVRRSRTPDEPAMLTIVYSLVLILVSYAIQFAAVALVFGPVWGMAYVATLVAGAYWAAFKAHPR
jgi:1-acyl-sn-glycerol-3-phosphate acyltransferase